MAEWSKAHAWKVCNRQKRFMGSNPILSAKENLSRGVARGFTKKCRTQARLKSCIFFVKDRRREATGGINFLLLGSPPRDHAVIPSPRAGYIFFCRDPPRDHAVIPSPRAGDIKTDLLLVRFRVAEKFNPDQTDQGSLPCSMLQQNP
jgi:hypothetical protein